MIIVIIKNLHFERMSQD